MNHGIDEYADQLFTIHGATRDDYPLADEIVELAGHARRLDIPNHFLDLFTWTHDIHRAVGCSSDEDGCGCFHSATAAA